MLIKRLVISAAFLSGTVLFGQTIEADWPVTLGFKGGIPVTDMMSASNTSLFGGNQQIPGSNYASHTPRYIIGASAEFHIPYGLRMEVDGLYRRGGFTGTNPFGTGLAYSPTSFNWWELPVLVKKNISLGHFRPFVDVGASLRHISTITRTAYVPGAPYPIIGDNASELHNRNSFGGVAGFGLTFKKGPFELTPEARYTRWSNQAFASAGGGLRTNLDQGDVLLGINF